MRSVNTADSSLFLAISAAWAAERKWHEMTSEQCESGAEAGVLLSRLRSAFVCERAKKGQAVSSLCRLCLALASEKPTAANVAAMAFREPVTVVESCRCTDALVVGAQPRGFFAKQGTKSVQNVGQS